jgi:large subunit ribosomal protein L32
MPTPKRKVSRARRDKRAANKGIKPKAITECLTCRAPIAPHQICKECGYYKGVKILRTKSDRKYARGQAKQAREEKFKPKQGSSTQEQGQEEKKES